MGEFQNRGDSIEGEKVHCNTRKAIPGGRFDFLGIGILWKYGCQTNAFVKIIEELNPKRFKYKSTSHLDLDDCISGEKIEVFSSDKLRFKKESNFSSTHGIQWSQSNSYTYAEIKIPYRYILYRNYQLSNN
jgi:hypothetical protein